MSNINNVKRIIVSLAVITLVYISIIAMLNQVLQPDRLMNDPVNAGRKAQERAVTAARMGPMIFAGILIIGFLSIFGIAKLRTSHYKRILKRIAKRFSLSINQDSIFTYPTLSGKFQGASIWVEIVEKGYDYATQVHVSLEDYAPPLTITRKSLVRKLLYTNHSVGGTKIVETVKTKGDSMTAHKALVPEAVALIQETKGTWHIRAGDVLYEETGVLADENLLTKVISAGLAMRKGLAS